MVVLVWINIRCYVEILDPHTFFVTSAGAVSTFFGTTRDTFEEKTVTYLEYEAYPAMALASMLAICEKVRRCCTLTCCRKFSCSMYQTI